MKKILITTVLLFGFIAVTPLHAQEEESVKVTIRENGRERTEEIELPLGMSYSLDSLLMDWHAKTYLQPDEGCSSSNINPQVSDSVIMDRLKRLPTVMEMAYNDIVREFIDRYTTKQRKQVALMVGACNFYMPIFEEALEAYGLPLELKYLPIIESALNPVARSRVGATGLWQFMLNTGKLYGLENNSYVDERRDPIKSSWAAARYLKDMYDIYRDWNLVIAAYNCGPGNVNKAIRRTDGKADYWAIYNRLPKQTRGYVPAFIAATYVMNYYCKHNICPMRTDLPAATDTIMVNRDLHFQQIADLCQVDMEMLKSLNPQYKRNILPGDTKPQTLRLPVEAVSRFIDQQDSIYNHRAGEFFKNRRTVGIGGQAAKISKSGKVVAGDGDLIYHRIRNGENLGSIALKYGVTVSQLRKWNGLKNNNIRAGKQLKIYR